VASAGTVAVVQADGADKAPIVKDAIPVRLEPSLPEQPATTKTTVIDTVQQPSTTKQQPSTTEQPSQRLNIVYIEGRPAVQWMDASGKLNFRWATPEDLESSKPPEGGKVGAGISRATLQEVEIRTQAIITEVAFSPGSVVVHAFLSGTIDRDARRPYSVGGFGGFISLAM
jgi:hypothetical protein